MENIALDNSSTVLPAVSNVTYAPILEGDDLQGFSLSTGCKDDYACFAIWNAALVKQDEISADLADKFDVIGDFEIHWSQKHYNRNIARLYERNGGFEEFEQWNDKIGPPPFRFIIVRDRKPVYTWKQSVSGAIEPSNENIVAAKYKYRAMFEKEYQIHSSNNISELLAQIALVLGPDRAQRVLSSTTCSPETLHKDLEGAEGWENWHDLFAVLNFGCKYLVLRNYEGLPAQLEDTDIDFLCDHFQRLASAANVDQSEARPFKGTINVDGQSVSVDIRYVGDGYYPAPWQIDMLQRRTALAGFYVPAPDDLFFSLLYHCKVQKPTVKPKYGPELGTLAQKLRFSWFDPSVLDDDVQSARLLAGYLRARGFVYENPVDQGVFENGPIVDKLPQRFIALSSRARGYEKLKGKIVKAVRQPGLIIPYVLKKMKLARSS